MIAFVPNPLLLATPVYALLLFLSQRPEAPEQERWTNGTLFALYDI